jgi:ERCC4-related helicase
MNGSTKIREKNDLIDRFKAGDLKVLITNVQKGLDFGRCNHCIFYCYDPSPNKMVQFEGRMTREYNIIDKHVYLLISRGSELNKFKKDVADKAKGSDMFAGSDFSCVMSLLLNEDTLKKIK